MLYETFVTVLDLWRLEEAAPQSALNHL